MENKIILLAIVTLSLIPLGMTSVYAATSTGSWSNTQTSTSADCGSDLTNTNEYSCATVTSEGIVTILTKANGWLETVTADAEINKNGSTIGSSPEITTSLDTVTFSGKFNATGTIQENSGADVSVIYGVTLYKKNGSSWSEAGYCNRVMFEDGTYSKINDVVECSVSNSGSNTYRIEAYVDSAVIMNFSSGASYADFYTGNNKIVLANLVIN